MQRDKASSLTVSCGKEGIRKDPGGPARCSINSPTHPLPQPVFPACFALKALSTPSAAQVEPPTEAPGLSRLEP